MLRRNKPKNWSKNSFPLGKVTLVKIEEKVISVCGRHYEEGEMSESTMYETIWELIYNGKVLCVCVSSTWIRGPFDKNE